jgi:hypothetical protein
MTFIPFWWIWLFITLISRFNIENDREWSMWHSELNIYQSRLLCVVRSFGLGYFVNLDRIEDYEGICADSVLKSDSADGCMMVDNHSEIEWLCVLRQTEIGDCLLRSFMQESQQKEREDRSRSWSVGPIYNRCPPDDRLPVTFRPRQPKG